MPHWEADNDYNSLHKFHSKSYNNILICKTTGTISGRLMGLTIDEIFFTRTRQDFTNFIQIFYAFIGIK